MPTDRRLWARWVLAFTLGELVGFGLLPALGGALAHVLLAGLPTVPRALATYALAVVAGAGEGAVLAWFQWRVLRDRLAGLTLRTWVLATAPAAALAWMAGMLPTTLGDLLPALPVSAQVALALPLGVFVLFSIGASQAWALRAYVQRPSRWLWANVLGWLLGLPWTFVLPAMLPDDSAVALFGGALFVGGVLMGVTAGLATGWAVVRMRPSGESPPPTRAAGVS